MFRYRVAVATIICGAVVFVGAHAQAADKNPTPPPMSLPEPPGAVQPLPKPQPQQKTYEFRAEKMKWDDVFDWYAKTSGLTLITTVKPTQGTFTFIPPAGAKLTLEEIEDAINEALEMHKMTLVRRHLTFFIQPTDEPFDARIAFRARTDLADLDRLARHEFVSVIIPLGKLKAEDLIPDVRKLLGTSGTMVLLDKSNALLVQGRVGNLRQIAKLIRDSEPKLAEKPKPTPPKTHTVRFKEAKWDDVFAWYVKEMGCVLESAAKPKGTFTCLPLAGRAVTSADVTDLINEELMKQKLILVRGHKSAAVGPIGKIDPKSIPAIELKDLPTRGRSELVEVAIPITTIQEPAEVVAEELKKLFTPFGTLVLAKGKWVIIRDTAGNVSRIMMALKVPCAEEPPAPPKKADPRIDVPTPMPTPKPFSFTMKDAKWADVFDTYAKLSGLKAVINSKPTGTFTFAPPKADARFTLAEITDILNDALLARNHLLIRRHVTFVVVPADEKVDPVLVPRISLDELPERGRTELVRVILETRGIFLADILDEVKKLTGSLGSVMPHKSHIFIVTDTVGNIVKIKQKIDELTAEKK